VLAEEATIVPEEPVETATPERDQAPPEEYLTDEIPIAEPPAAEPVEPVAPAAPAARDVEAAADHFATGLRDSPEEVERELLADLEQPGPETVTIQSTAPPEPAPSWQEAGARPVEPEAPPPSPEPRNLPAAFISGILLAAAVVALLAIGKGPFAVLAGAVILLGQAEFYAVLRARGHRPATLLGLVAGALLVAGAYLKGEGAILVGLFIATAATALWYMAAAPEKRKGLVSGAGATLLGVAYVPFMASFALLLLRPAGSVGTTIFLAVVGLTIVYDIFAFAVGSWFGNRPLAPSISPSKTWEGAWGGTFIVLLAGIAIIPSLAPFEGRNAAAVGLALVVAAFAPLGDLVESAFKRDLGVKDMSGLLPGHGGILDRIDAILFTAPAAYLFLRMFL
jgi:phosphatidate cytidylyltransferase